MIGNLKHDTENDDKIRGYSDKGRPIVCSSDYLISFKFYHRLPLCFFVDFFANIILQVGALLINTYIVA